jgi:ectoine hydroxylase-related dioxygenase (phytanoyl-CoA dioxygenase family)
MNDSQADLSVRSVSGYRSRFGGFWPDRLDASSKLEQKTHEGEIGPVQVEQFRHWMERGYVVLPQAVPNDLVDAVNAEIARAWEGAFPDLWFEGRINGVLGTHRLSKEMRGIRGKLLDFYAVSSIVRDALFTQPLVEFLTALFERPPMIFQSLYFERGSQQRMHQDSAFVRVSSPMQFVGVWFALEDIVEGSGELEYYEGSHKIEEFLWDGVAKGMPFHYFQKPEHMRYLESLHEKAAALDLERKAHRPKKGDVLVWHADLVHGGSPQVKPEATRRSLAVHYCPLDVAPYFGGSPLRNGPIAHPSGGYYSFEHREQVSRSLIGRMSRKVANLLGRR